MEFKIHMEVPGLGRNVEVTDSRRFEDLATESGWTYCVSRGGDMWFYDGVSAFTLFRRQQDRVITLKSCSEPNLGDRAPKVMKQWIAKNAAQSAGPANGGLQPN